MSQTDTLAAPRNSKRNGPLKTDRLRHLARLVARTTHAESLEKRSGKSQTAFREAEHAADVACERLLEYARNNF